MNKGQRLERQVAAAIAEKNWPAARRALAQLDSALPGVAATAYNLALVLRREDKPGEAERWFLRALDRDPTYHRARFELAALLMDEGRLAEALAAFSDYLSACPNDPDALCNAGRVAQRLGRLEVASAYLERASSLRPGDPQIALAEAETLRDLGHHEEMTRLLRKVAHKHPELRPAILKIWTQGARGRIPLEAAALFDD